MSIQLRMLVTAGVLAILLLGLGELAARQQYHAAGAMANPPADCPAGAHDLNYFRVILTIAITYFLVTPALCLFAFRVPREPMGAWLAFWTASYATYLVHLYWAIAGMMGGQWRFVFDCPHLVNHPWNDTALTFAWGLDVVLAWIGVARRRDFWDSPRWDAGLPRVRPPLALRRSHRGLDHQGRELVHPRAGLLHDDRRAGLRVGRLVIKPFDSNSLGARLYIGLFEVINRFVPWHRLPTQLAVREPGGLSRDAPGQESVQHLGHPRHKRAPSREASPSMTRSS